MKKLIVLTCTILAIAVTTPCANAQNKNVKVGQEMSARHDGVLMKDGKMMIMKDNKMTAMTKDMTMKNGAKVMVNGRLEMKDGTTLMMKNGEMISMEGSLRSPTRPMEAKMPR